VDSLSIFGDIFKGVKKVGSTVGKTAYSVGKSAVSVVKKVPKPIVKLAYDTVVPESAKKVINKAVAVSKHVPLLKHLIKGGERTVNPVERVMREIVDVAQAALTGGNILTQLIEAVMALSPAYQEILEATPEGRVELFREALDNMIGSEEDALVGPNGVIPLDIPFVDDEKVTDLVIEGAVAIIKKTLLGGTTDAAPDTP